MQNLTDLINAITRQLILDQQNSTQKLAEKYINVPLSFFDPTVKEMRSKKEPSSERFRNISNEGGEKGKVSPNTDQVHIGSI